MNDIDPLITDKDIAAMWGCSVSSVWRRVREGAFPRPIKIGGMSRWHQSEGQRVIDDAKLKRETA